MVAGGIRLTSAEKIALIVAAALLLSAGSCNRAIMPPEQVKAFYCGQDVDKDGDIEIAAGSPDKAGAYVPVSLSKNDTDGTIEQTLVNNTTYDKTCGVAPGVSK